MQQYDISLLIMLGALAFAVLISLYFIDRSLRQLDNSLLSLRLDTSQITYSAQSISSSLIGIQAELMRLSSAQAALAAQEERRIRALQLAQQLSPRPDVQGRYGTGVAAQHRDGDEAQPRYGTDLRSGPSVAPPASQE